jgi:hypothetical protein
VVLSLVVVQHALRSRIGASPRARSSPRAGARSRNRSQTPSTRSAAAIDAVEKVGAAPPRAGHGVTDDRLQAVAHAVQPGLGGGQTLGELQGHGVFLSAGWADGGAAWSSHQLPGFLVEDPTRTEQREALWRMSPAERVAAMYRGDLTLFQRLAWAARYPEQVPTLNGEWWFTAIRTPDDERRLWERTSQSPTTSRGECPARSARGPEHRVSHPLSRASVTGPTRRYRSMHSSLRHRPRSQNSPGAFRHSA